MIRNPFRTFQKGQWFVCTRGLCGVLERHKAALLMRLQDA